MKALRNTLQALLLGGAAIFGVLFYYVQHWTPPAEVYPAEIRVAQGESLAAVTRKLSERRLIPGSWLFTLWARSTGGEKKIHQGLYRFEAPVSPGEVLDRLIHGRGIFQTVTIPEGFTLREIAGLLAKLQIADENEFLAHAEDPELLRSLDLGGRGLEGYLFPSTYHFTPDTPEKDVIAAMIEQFRKSSLPLLTQYDGVALLNPYQVLTLASIIEKETGIDAERPLVSAVFHNRLKRQMPLQSDPTVIYGIRGFDGNLTRKHLQDATPYNTYRIPGLPPGPICNPGLSSIRAALRPAPVAYLYFVSKNDGTHVFSETLDEHNQAVKTYQPVRGAARVKGSRR